MAVAFAHAPLAEGLLSLLWSSGENAFTRWSMAASMPSLLSWALMTAATSSMRSYLAKRRMARIAERKRNGVPKGI
jgi:hypothetical protein